MDPESGEEETASDVIVELSHALSEKARKLRSFASICVVLGLQVLQDLHHIGPKDLEYEVLVHEITDKLESLND